MNSRVIVPGVVEVVADGSGQQDAQVLLAHLLPQTAELNHAVHHLTHAEAVAEVVERVVSVVLLYAQLATQTITVLLYAQLATQTTTPRELMPLD